MAATWKNLYSKPTGRNLGCVFNSRKLCLCLSLTMHPTLELKTRLISFSPVRYRAPQLSLQLHTSCLSDIFLYTSYFKNWKFIFRLYSALFIYNNKYVLFVVREVFGDAKYKLRHLKRFLLDRCLCLIHRHLVHVMTIEIVARLIVIYRFVK